MDGGKLHIVAVDGLLDHCLVQGGGVLAAGGGVAAFCFGGDSHQESAGAASQVGDVEGCREFVVAPVHMGRPVVKDQMGKQGSRRHGGVVGAGELGVAEQQVEKTPGQVMPFQMLGNVHGVNKGIDGGPVIYLRNALENFQNFRSQLKNRHVVDSIANMTPDLMQGGRIAAPHLGDGRNILADSGESFLKSQGVEQYQAGNAEGFRPVGFLVGLGNEVGDAAGLTGVAGNLFRRLFEGVADDPGGGHYDINVLQVQG